MTKRTIILLTLAAIGIAGALAFRSFRAKPDNRILISGNIELTQVNIAFKVSGRLISRTVDEGDPVKKGMVVATLDRDQLLRQREREVATLAARGYSNAQIADRLVLSVRTVEGHLQRIYAKLGVADRRSLGSVVIPSPAES